MRVVVYGGRDYADRNNVFRWLDKLFAPVYGTGEEPYQNGTVLPRPDLVIIDGGARGVDTFASDWATVNWVKNETYRADWNRYGNGAGTIRNKAMVDAMPDMGLAFPGGIGTANMTMQLHKARIPVMEIPC